MQLFPITTLLVSIAAAIPSYRDVRGNTPVRIRIGVDRAASQTALTVLTRDRDVTIGKSCSATLNTGNFAQFPIISQLDDNGSGTGSITIGNNVYTIHSDTDASGGISCSRLFGEDILLIECDATIPATKQLIPVATEELSTCVTDTFFSAILENEALQPAFDPPTEGSSTDFNSTDFKSTELDTELSKRQTPSPCIQWSPFTEKDGDGSPTQSMQFIQLSENIFCGAASECSAGREDSTSYAIGFSVAGALTRWASVGFAVEQSRSTDTTLNVNYKYLIGIVMAKVTYGLVAIYNEESGALTEIVSLLSDKNPTLKIIEVGNGTGSATRKVLPALNGHVQQKLEASIYPEIKAFPDIKGRHMIGDIDRDSQARIFTQTSAAELLEGEIEIDVQVMDFSNKEVPLQSPSSKWETGFVAWLSLIMLASGCGPSQHSVTL
ncbi:hypothetical protein T069G_08831 [Trichoderma breve]|uniref:Uncharacterized protein n=1 Tax=Trichoderma breve TaxID=2034170 RepID=A0A9W9BAV3_9HYPO|nr:hypothetical protein T069G_08831 [Trichoderma breve]KAJ4857934.1 hypothetical protein T069G_08831 [Trichoderma breve]